MAANVRSMRVICSPEREEDVAAARELLHPPQSPVSLLSPLPWPWDALPACAGDLPLHPQFPSPHPSATWAAMPEGESSRPYFSVPSKSPGRSKWAGLMWAPIPKEIQVAVSLLLKVSLIPTLWGWWCCLHCVCHGHTFKICSALLPKATFP